MKTLDWLRFSLDEGVLRETIPDDDRIVFWLRVAGTDPGQDWERVSSVPRGPIHRHNGICATPATLIRARERAGGLLGKLVRSFRRGPEAPVWILPNGASAEQCGNRQTDLVLAWAEDESGPLDDERIRSRWPASERRQRIGNNLYLVSGVRPPVVKNDLQPGPNQGCPREQAEQLLAEARLSGDRRAAAAALADLAAVLLQTKEAPQALALLEEAVTLARQSGDRAVAADVQGNLGLAMLTLGQVEQARQVLEQTLASNREANDPVAEKLTLERLGIACSRLGDHAQAFGCFEQALTLARRLSDRKHEGELLWFLAIEHAEMGHRGESMSRARAAVEIFQELKRPEAGALASDLRKYEREESASWPVPAGAPGPVLPADALGGGSFVVSAAASLPDAASAGRQTRGPGLLRMALSAARSMSHYLASGMTAVPPDVHRRRLEVCAGCEQHTGLRCRVCGCFTNLKAWLPHESCPLGKWQANR
jgi:Tetratricopeptide repeat/Family of unknown function (DUF6171)